MIPQFPKFKKLEITDKEEIEKITSQFPPYSDFNFTSLWCWDTKGKARLSILNDNLVVRFTDYITGEPFYSFSGDNNPDSTIQTLLSFFKNEGIAPYLKLVPGHSLTGLSSNKNEDRNNFDYIYAIDALQSYKGGNYEQQRHMKNRFSKKYNNIEVMSLNLSQLNDRNAIMQLGQQWEINKGYKLDNEEDAMTRLLFPTNNFTLITVGVFVDRVPVAFSISEPLKRGYAITHFAKANIKYSGIYSYLMCATANALASAGCALLNYEQDLGVPGLRYAKSAFRPAYFLKKYVIQS